MLTIINQHKDLKISCQQWCNKLMIAIQRGRDKSMEDLKQDPNQS